MHYRSAEGKTLAQLWRREELPVDTDDQRRSEPLPQDRLQPDSHARTETGMELLGILGLEYPEQQGCHLPNVAEATPTPARVPWLEQKASPIVQALQRPVDASLPEPSKPLQNGRPPFVATTWATPRLLVIPELLWGRGGSKTTGLLGGGEFGFGGTEA